MKNRKNRPPGLPVPTIRRLPLYLSYLKKIQKNERKFISAPEIANYLHVDPTQITKDFSIINITGKPKVGYQTDELIRIIEDFLGYNDPKKAFIVGIGNLGSALFRYTEFKKEGLEIIALFDIDTENGIKEINNLQISHIDKFKERFDETPVEIGIITVPSDQAQKHVLPDDIKNEKARLLLKEAAITKLGAIHDRIKSEGITTDKPILEFGSHLDKIIQTADTINANVILIGAGEKSENDAFQLGTTAEKIIRKSYKPVWVVKRDKPLNIKNILCPVDFSPESKRALKNAIIMARKFKARLIIFNAYKMDYPSALSSKMDWDEENDRKASEHRNNFNSFLEGVNLTDLNWDKEIRGGDPATEIRKAISRYKSDLNLMGATGESGLSRILMGSVTEKVIREVPCSFITLKSEDIIELYLETRIRDIESHYSTAGQLMKDGFYDESINQFKVCLNINDMHIPSLNGIAKVYENLDDNESAEKYKNMAKEVLPRI